MQTTKSYKFTPLLYCLANGFFYAAMAAIAAYTTVYLSGKGVPDSITAAVVSLSALISNLATLVMSNLLDKYPKLLSKHMATFTTGVSAVSAVIAVLFDENPTILIIFFTIAFIFEKATISTMSTVSVKSNVHITYAVPRGIGSATYAIVCLIAGFLTAKFGSDIVMLLFIPLMAITSLSIALMPEDHIYVEPKKDENKSSYFTMVKNNRPLLLFLIATFFIGVGNSCSMTFLIRIIQDCGGDSSNLGVATFIQAMAEVPMTILMVRLIKKYKFEDLLVVSFIMYAVRLFSVGSSQSIPMLYCAVALNFFCVGIYSTSSVRFAKLIVQPDESARSQALLNFFSGTGMGTFAGAALQVVLIDLIGPRGIFLFCAGVSFLGFLTMLPCRKAIKKVGYANPDF